MIQESPSTCVVSWPTAPLTNALVLRSLKHLQIPLAIRSSPLGSYTGQYPIIQWSTYDQIDHELTHIHRRNVLSSSYTFRKALIRKHYLSRCIASYVTKHPTSALKSASPKTFEIEISFADELDELWVDELWDLGEQLETAGSWWILKPGMADRGMGVRLFNSKNALQHIFEEFEDASSDDSDVAEGGTAVLTSQLRHFVIQEYINNPLLFYFPTVKKNSSLKDEGLKGHKFHLRAYCVCKGALEVYLYDRILALFSAVPYVELTASPVKTSEFHAMDLAPHLTNTSLQHGSNQQATVYLLEELIGCQVMSTDKINSEFKCADMGSILDQMVKILAETFKAALENPIHFQPLPNAFELYGIDFLIAHEPSPATEENTYQVKLLEINAEPAIEFTGPRLTWILEDLFDAIGKVCVEPFIIGKDLESSEWKPEEVRYHMIKCFEKGVRVGC